jgi:hypothetical protein
MTGSEALEQLAERAEKATGRDRALELDIHEALGNCVHREKERYAVQSDTGFTCKACHEDMYGAKSAPTYTASIDAALQLVPEGQDAIVRRFPDGRGGAHVYPAMRATLPSLKAATPALALTAAALRARASQEAGYRDLTVDATDTASIARGVSI